MDGFTEQVVRRWGSGGRWAGARTLAAGNPFLPKSCQIFLQQRGSWEVKQALATNVNVSRCDGSVYARMRHEDGAEICSRTGGEVYRSFEGWQVTRKWGGNVTELSGFSTLRWETGGVFLLGLATNPHTPQNIGKVVYFR